MSEQLTEEQRAATPCLVALCPDCKLIVACAVDLPEFAKDTAKSAASWIRDRLTVTTMRVDAVRAATWGHADDCASDPRKKKKQKPANAPAASPKRTPEANRG